MIAFLSSILSFALIFFSFSADEVVPPVPEKFKNYWYEGKAEITTYDLKQARYGELRDGQAVMIFVTEDFSQEKQVKLDDPFENPGEAVRVMKLNSIRKFNTGIYPYSMMLSVFSPVSAEFGHRALKATGSSQEWCGHTFEQINKDRNEYQILQRSYFESEGDREYEIPLTWLEDELWNLIRIDPEKLPTGQIKLVPGLISSRLTHSELKPQFAEVTLLPGGSSSEYIIRYAESGRTLKINFKTEFPHEIESWEETFKSGFGANARMLTTRAEKRAREKVAYWKLNGTNDAHWRDSLQLTQ